MEVHGDHWDLALAPKARPNQQNGLYWATEAAAQKHAHGQTPRPTPRTRESGVGRLKG